MPLPAGTYIVRRWHSTNNPSAPSQSDIQRACVRLVKGLSSQLAKGKLALPSHDTPSTRKGVEISIVYPPNSPPPADIAQILTNEANSLGLAFKSFEAQDDGAMRVFSSSDLGDMMELYEAFVEGMDSDAAIAAQCSRAEQLTRYLSNREWIKNLSSEVTEPFRVSRESLQKLHQKEGSDLKEEILNILKRAGVDSRVDHSLTANPTNVLLVVNQSSSDVMPITDQVEYGKRKSTAKRIPATPTEGDHYGGLFVYMKVPSFRGSTFGIAFNSEKGDFSVGMDCPNTGFGGSNSIEVCTGNNTREAVRMALNSGCKHGWINSPRVDVKSGGAGTINWGRVIVM